MARPPHGFPPAASGTAPPLAAVFAAGVALGALLARALAGNSATGGRAAGRGGGGNATAAAGEELKLVLVVNKGLRMGAGKLAAQCAHGAAAAVEGVTGGALARWRQQGQPKIVVQCPGDAELRELERASRAHGLPTHVVRDAGRTQVAAGSRTVLAVGPAARSAVDAVTGRLSLL